MIEKMSNVVVADADPFAFHSHKTTTLFSA